MKLIWYGASALEILKSSQVILILLRLPSSSFFFFFKSDIEIFSSVYYPPTSMKLFDEVMGMKNDKNLQMPPHFHRLSEAQPSLFFQLVPPLLQNRIE